MGFRVPTEPHHTLPSTNLHTVKLHESPVSKFTKSPAPTPSPKSSPNDSDHKGVPEFAQKIPRCKYQYSRMKGFCSGYCYHGLGFLSFCYLAPLWVGDGPQASRGCLDVHDLEPVFVGLGRAASGDICKL